MSPTATAPAAPKTVTPDDLLRMPDGGAEYELVDGELREINMSTESSHVAGTVLYHLGHYCRTVQPGWVFPVDAGFQCFPAHPNRVRKPGAAYLALPRLTPQQYRAEGFCPVAPDLVVEVLSPNDYATEVDAKVEEWLAAGVRVVWVVNPEARTVRVHRADGGYAFLRDADTLTAPDLLPGFACPVADLFRLPGPVPQPT